ncbi:MAG: pyridoxal phosphate-dependent aminotransferase [Sandaracinaceae bacterium]
MTAPDLAERIGWIQPSATLVMTQRARELRAQGVDVLSFGAGEPDFDTPTPVREHAKRALDDGATHYTAVAGIPELRSAIRDVSARRRGGQVHELDEIVVSVGAKHSLFNLAMALYDPGDEVIVPAPHWVSYPDQVALLGARPVIVPTAEEGGFKLTPAALEAAVTPRTKALILNTPCNPTGSAYTAEELRALADVALRGRYWVLVDEIYGELVYDGFEHRSLLEVAPALRDRLVIVDGVSKTFAMTGWRIGWTLSPAGLARAMVKIQGQMTSNAAAVSQHAAMAALRGGSGEVDRMREAFAARRRLVVDGLNAIDGLSCREPEGAFYAFVNVRGWLGRRAQERVLEDDVALATWLLDEARCATVPGTAFGAPGYIRLSYATDEASLAEGLRRIAAAGASLRGD